MSNYKIVAAIWEDHSKVQSSPLPKQIKGFINPSLTLGFLYKETDEHVVLVSHIERYDDGDECDYMIIRKEALLAPLKEYGDIEIKKLRSKEGS